MFWFQPVISISFSFKRRLYEKSILNTTILLSASILSMATVSVFADDELVPTTAVTEVANHSGRKFS